MKVTQPNLMSELLTNSSVFLRVSSGKCFILKPIHWISNHCGSLQDCNYSHGKNYI